MNIDILVAKVLNWCSLPDNEGWLLIFDNVDRITPDADGVDIRAFLPPVLNQGSVIVTTRMEYLARLGTGISLKEMSESESREFYMSCASWDCTLRGEAGEGTIEGKQHVVVKWSGLLDELAERLRKQEGESCLVAMMLTMILGRIMYVIK